ncbi:hypothetical protein [Actinoplanes aureus]|nr:hypothetical protein [Actinoplanes aureus]
MLLDHMGITAEDQLQAPGMRSRVPTFAEYVPWCSLRLGTGPGGRIVPYLRHAAGYTAGMRVGRTEIHPLGGLAMVLLSVIGTVALNLIF